MDQFNAESLLLNVLNIDLPARSHNVNQQAKTANTPPHEQCKVLPYFINCKMSVRINVPLFYVSPKRKHTHTLFIKLWDTTDCKKHPDYGDVKTKSGSEKNVYT